MAHLDDFIKGIINGEIPTPSANAAEIQTLIDTIGAEEDAVKGEYSKIGELYYKLHSDRTDGELGALVKGVNGSKKKILDSKMRIGALLDLAAGSSLEKAVKTVCFLADMNDFAAFNAVYGKYFTSKPARSCVAVKTLPKNVSVEVEVIAEL